MPGSYLAKGFKNNPGNKYVRISLVHNILKCKSAIENIEKLLK